MKKVLNKAESLGLKKVAKKVTNKEKLKKKVDASVILKEMSVTFKERNKIYGDNYKIVGLVMSALFPDGVRLKTIDDYNTWHLFELMIVKLTRFANTNMTHKDSIHDAAVYAAMVESLLPEEESDE